MHRIAITLSAALAVAGCRENPGPGAKSEASPPSSASPSTPSPAPNPAAASGRSPAGAEAADPRARLQPLPEAKLRRGDPPRRSATADEVRAGIERLSGLVKAGATDPGNPWAMAHGLLAFGPDLKTSDGRRVVDAIVKDHLDTRTVDGRTVTFFHERTPSLAPVEPHPFMISKAFAEAGVPLDRTLRFAGGKTSLRKLLDDAEWQFDRPQGPGDWQNAAWLLSLFAAHPPEDGALTTHAGDVPLRSVAAAALEELERLQAFLKPLMEVDRPDLVQKRRQGIYAHTCGGLHFVQGVARAAGRYDALLPRVRTQLAISRFRWAAERRIYSRMVNLKPKYRPLLLIQQLKFYGHLLETMALAVRWDLLQPDAALKAEMRLVAGDLLDTIRALEPFYARLDGIQQATPQSYNDLVGDGCHAVRGLREALVAFY